MPRSGGAWGLFLLARLERIMIKVGIVGGTGYTGVELLRLRRPICG